MRLGILIISMLVVGNVHAQHLDEGSMGFTANSSFIGISGYGAGASDGLQNAFIKEMMFEEVVSSESVDRLIGKLSTTNRGGADYMISLDGVWFIKDGWSLLVSAKDQAHVSARWSNDFMELALKGNKVFQGNTADIGGSQGRYLRFQSYGLGASKSNARGELIGMTLSLVNGERMADFQIDRGVIETSPLGDSILLDVNGKVFWSDTSNHGFLAQNGGGASLVLFGSKCFVGDQADWWLNFSMRDLGLIQWHPPSGKAEIDTVIDYTGIEVSNFAAFDDPQFVAQTEDSLVGGFDDSFGKGIYESVLPGWVQLYMRRKVDQGIEAGIGSTWRWASNARTYVWVDGAYRFNSHWMAGAEIGFGGYSKVQASLNAEFITGDLAARARIGNLEAFVLPKTFGGAAASVSVQYRFGG